MGTLRSCGILTVSKNNAWLISFVLAVLRTYRANMNEPSPASPAGPVGPEIPEGERAIGVCNLSLLKQIYLVDLVDHISRV